jgi:hypothetical protein
MLTLTQFDAEKQCLSVTEHETLAQALAEYKGWEKAGAVAYLVQGTMNADCVCKRTMESRNRTIYLKLAAKSATGDISEDHIELKAPQACKYLSLLFGGAPATEFDVTITNDEFRIG